MITTNTTRDRQTFRNVIPVENFFETTKWKKIKTHTAVHNCHISIEWQLIIGTLRILKCYKKNNNDNKMNCDAFFVRSPALLLIVCVAESQQNAYDSWDEESPQIENPSKSIDSDGRQSHELKYNNAGFKWPLTLCDENGSNGNGQPVVDSKIDYLAGGWS